MAPSWAKKIKSKFKGTRPSPPLESSPLSPPTPSQPAEPASQEASRPAPPPTPEPTSQPTASRPADPEAPYKLQEQLWNQAYDGLRLNESKIVDAYETILSTELHRTDSTSAAVVPRENKIGQTRETRWRQMQQLVQAGLERTEKEAAIKRGVDDGLQSVYAVKGIMDKAVQAAPEAALAWVGVCFGLEILSNPVTEAGINRRGIAYVLSRMNWYWNLVSLLLDQKKAEKSSAGLRDELESHIVQLYEKLLLYQMKSVCLYRRNWATTVLRDMFKLDNWDDQLNEIHDAETAVQKDSEQYNSEQVKSHLRDLSDAAHSQELRLQDIHSALQDQTRLQEKRYQDDKYEQCLKDLHLTDPRDDKKRIQDTKGGLLGDSYRWILDHADFQRFRDDPQSRLLWIKGDPGKGKTMLLCGIIDELEKESANRLSYFFCQATEAQLSNATAVLRGLIYLLIVQQPSLISYVRVKYDVAGEKLFEGINVWVSLTEILTRMLRDPTLEDVVLVVDALDECRTNLPQLLGFIGQASSSSRAKWIVSSRNWPDIEAQLEDVQKVRVPLELNKDSISSAVHTYIRYKVDRLAHDKKYDKETRDAVQHHLISYANGTFLWVALVCQELADSKAANSKVRKLHTLTKLKTFPPGLNSLYRRMIEHICDSDDADLCKEILAIASVVYRPITLKELKVLVASLEDFDDDDLQEIIGSCGSFLTLRGEVIYFVHQSAKDFLLTKASDLILPSGIAHQHRMVSSRSLEVLSKTLRRDIYSLRAPGFPIDQVSPPEPDPLDSTRYSCIYWVDHLCDSDPVQRNGHDKALQDGGAVHTFLQDKYLYWLESLSLLCSMSEGVMAVQKLEALVKSMEARQLTELLRDARRFILSHKRAMEIAPLQVYASALVFSPTRSLVRELFKKEEPDWITLKPSMESDWNACLQTLEGHDDSVRSLVFSADGQRLASRSDDKAIHDKTIKVWDATTGDCLQTLKGHGDWVESVVFSADGQRLASGSDDNTVKVWDATTGDCLQTLEGHGDSVLLVVFSADGQRLASSSYDRTIKVWDATTGDCLQTLEGHDDSVRSVVFSADGQRLAVRSVDKTIKVWDATMGACLQTLKGHSVLSLAFSADGQRLASGSFDTTIKVWDATTGDCLQTLEGHDDSVRSVAFSADGQRLASSSDNKTIHDKTIKVWDATTGACLQTLKGHGEFVFSADGQRLASGSDNNTIKVWDATTGDCLQTLEGHGDSVLSVAFSADGQRLASSSFDSTIKVWDVNTGACPPTLEGHDDSVRSLVFSADGQRLASSCNETIYDKTIKVWDATTGAYLRTLKGHDGWVNSVVFSADSQWLASGSYDKTIKVWDATTGTCLQTLKGHDASVQSVVFSADGQRLASSSDDWTVKVWDATTGACLQTLEVHGGWLMSLVFSADGQWLAIEVVDETGDSYPQKFKVHDGSVQSDVFSADGQDLSPVIDNQSTEAALRGVSHSGCGRSSDGLWIVKDGKNMLRLPAEYRWSAWAVVESTVAIGCRSGRVLMMRFS